LQISGIGEQQLLDKLGVEPVAVLPVGQNFVDRPTWTVQIAASDEQQPLPKFLGYTVPSTLQRVLLLSLSAARVLIASWQFLRWVWHLRRRGIGFSGQ